MFKHEHREESTIIEATDSYRAEIGDYTVMLRTSDHVAKLSINPTNWQDDSRLAYFDLQPKSVAEIEQFATDAPELFRAIAAALRELGMEDLRSKWDKWRDDMERQVYKDISEYSGPVVPTPEIK